MSISKLIFAVIAIFLIFKMCTANQSDRSDINDPFENNEKFPPSVNSIYQSNTSSDVDDDYSNGEYSNDETFHTNTDYKYEYRTGTSGNYEYNYDINGSDEYGNAVYGNVDMDGKYGDGIIEDSEGNELEVDVEWVDHGVLEATDEEGNTYDLYVDE